LSLIAGTVFAMCFIFGRAALLGSSAAELEELQHTLADAFGFVQRRVGNMFRRPPAARTSD
jgi:hypothetical protein